MAGDLTSSMEMTSADIVMDLLVLPWQNYLTGGSREKGLCLQG